MVKKAKLKNTLARFQANKKKTVALGMNPYNPMNFENQKHKKNNHKQITQKDILPFTEEESILFVGEGNFSFACSLAELFPSNAYRMIATCYDSETQVKEKYEDAVQKINTIEDLGGTVLYEIDATKLSSLKVFKNQRFDKIVFNFPHVGAGIKDQDRNIRSNQVMLKDFFYNAADLLSSRQVFNDMNDGEIMVTLKSGNPYDLWDIKKLAKQSGKLLTKTSFMFNPKLYPGYQHRRTIGFSEGLSKPENEEIIDKNCRTYVFVKVPPPPEKKKRVKKPPKNDKSNNAKHIKKTKE